MDVVRGKVAGGWIDRDTVLAGIIEGDAVVGDGTYLELRGIVTGDLGVEPGGRADVRGVVNGTLVNAGGEVSVYGIVGDIVDSGGRRTHVAPGAKILAQERVRNIIGSSPREGQERSEREYNPLQSLVRLEELALGLANVLDFLRRNTSFSSSDRRRIGGWKIRLEALAARERTLKTEWDRKNQREKDG